AVPVTHALHPFILGNDTENRKGTGSKTVPGREPQSCLGGSLAVFLAGRLGIGEAKQLRRFGPKLQQLRIGWLVLLHPLDRLVEPLAGLASVASLLLSGP